MWSHSKAGKITSKPFWKAYFLFFQKKITIHEGIRCYYKSPTTVQAIELRCELVAESRWRSLEIACWEIVFKWRLIRLHDKRKLVSRKLFADWRCWDCIYNDFYKCSIRTTFNLHEAKLCSPKRSWQFSGLNTLVTRYQPSRINFTLKLLTVFTFVFMLM